MKNLIIVALLMLLCSVAWADPSGLSVEQKKLLVALGAPVMVPTFVPPGFEAVSVIATLEQPGVGRGKQYRITYQDAALKTFWVESTPGGIGGPDGDQVLPGNSAHFGPTSVHVFLPQGEMKKYICGDWLGQGPFFRAASPGGADQSYLETVSPETMLKVHQSLAPMQ